MMRSATTLAVVLPLIFFIQAPGSAQNWPQWRGPTANGISEAANPPTEWSRDKNVLWRTELPGPGGATPVVWGDQIFVTSVDGNDLVLLCFGTDGKPQWKKKVGPGNKNVRGDEGNSASPSPSTDGTHVWVFFANGLLACYKTDGTEVWKFNVEDRFGKLSIAFGMTSTPILDGDRLYLQLIHGEGKVDTREATVACLNATDGTTIWKTGRPSDARAECEHSYASPLLYRDKNHEFFLTHGADYAVAYDLKDGSELWRVGDLNPKGSYNPTLRFVASPVAGEGIIVIPTAKKGKVIAVSPDAEGDITLKDDAYVWKMPQNTPDVPSPLIKDGLVYLCRENGNLMCLDAKSGEVLYEERTERDRHRASPVWANSHVYTTARNGKVTVTKAGRQFEIVAQNEIDEPTTASPVIVGDRIYLRSFDALWAIGK